MPATASAATASTAERVATRCSSTGETACSRARASPGADPALSYRQQRIDSNDTGLRDAGRCRCFSAVSCLKVTAHEKGQSPTLFRLGRAGCAASLGPVKEDCVGFALGILFGR